MAYTNLIKYLIIGIFSITLVDTLGAVASRKMNFKYIYLSFISIAIYILVAFFVSKEYILINVLLTNAILGLYDCTIGLWLSIVLRANNGLTAEQIKELFTLKSSIAFIVISVFFGLIGFELSKI
ncbi:MAG TPA: hypothetical protein PKC82_00550 [Chitinophagaceae bacterium]|nr:hypothetical protein [Chitinophagaceae bacterium]HNA96012.1 hypothetical protein [Chitinophagaceae bacterium]